MAKNDNDSVDGLPLPTIGIKSIIEERKVKHELNMHKYAFDLFEDLDIKEQIIQAVDKGRDSVLIEFPKNLRVSVNKMFVGKITYGDVWTCFSNLLDLEQINFQFNYSKAGGCCFEPENEWADFKDASPNQAAHACQFAICRFCGKYIHYYGYGWRRYGPQRSFDEKECCDQASFENDGGISDNPPCINCEKEFCPIPKDGESVILGLEIQIP